MRIFRDDVWGKLRAGLQANHRTCKRIGGHDFAQRYQRVRLNTLVAPLLRVEWIREAFTSRIKEGMIRPYQRVLQGQGCAVVGSAP
jgi:hypothetical protein